MNLGECFIMKTILILLTGLSCEQETHKVAITNTITAVIDDATE